LPALAADGAFRHDLLARLDGFTFEMPCLADRREDFGGLVAALLSRVPRPPSELSVEAARALLGYGWPLNIRELEQGMTAAAVLADGAVLTERMLPARVRACAKSNEQAAAAPADELVAKPELLTDNERATHDKLIHALRETHGNVAEVARSLGKAPNQIHRWMRRFGISPDSFRQPR
jgi:DNA-binding NtrC family response regulator